MFVASILANTRLKFDTTAQDKMSFFHQRSQYTDLAVH